VAHTLAEFLDFIQIRIIRLHPACSIQTTGKKIFKTHQNALQFQVASVSQQFQHLWFAIFFLLPLFSVAFQPDRATAPKETGADGLPATDPAALRRAGARGLSPGHP